MTGNSFWFHETGRMSLTMWPPCLGAVPALTLSNCTVPLKTGTISGCSCCFDTARPRGRAAPWVCVSHTRRPRGWPWPSGTREECNTDCPADTAAHSLHTSRKNHPAGDTHRGPQQRHSNMEVRQLKGKL